LAYKNALSAYKEIRINTASQGQLIIMLYNEAVKQLDSALGVLGDDGRKDLNRIEKVSKSVVKTQEIISELMVSLDFEQGGDVATNLFSLYAWFNRELMEANINQDAEKISTVRNFLEDLRAAWQKVALTTAAETVSREAVGVNIAG
jgi:flagellar protein FliS